MNLIIKSPKSIYILLILYFTTHCSFDNKTGIWQDGKKILIEESKVEKTEEKLTTLFKENAIFNEEKVFDSKKKLDSEKVINITRWTAKFHNDENNLPNVFYQNKKEKILKTSKFSSDKNLSNSLFYGNNIIFYNNRGTIFIYSIASKKKIFEYNFYKKRFKKNKKYINLVYKNGIIYASDNLGYVYAISIANKKVIWAKNSGIPFRSNIKIADNSLFLANQENKIYSINIANGKQNWQFSSNETFLKSDFQNNIIINKVKNNVYFFNTNGELYSIDYYTKKINWVLNLKSSYFKSDTDLFEGLPLVMHEDYIIASTGSTIQNVNSLSGTVICNKSIHTSVRPIISKNKIFITTKNNLLVCLDLITGKIIWSKNIITELMSVDTKYDSWKTGAVISLSIVNNQIYLLTKNGYLITFNYNGGEITSLLRITKSKIKEEPFFVNGYLHLIEKNRIVIYE